MSALELPSFGKRGNRMGFELALRWRMEHASIRKVVVYTGEDVETLSKPNGVDALICKTDIDGVIEALFQGEENMPLCPMG